MFFAVIVIQFIITHGIAFSDEDMNNLIPKNYTTTRPLDKDPIFFSWSLRVHLVSDLSAKEMEFTVDLTIWSFWKDNQLNINTDHYINLPKKESNKLWFPWLRFSNCKGCQSEIINPDDDTFSISSKYVWAIYRKASKFTCILNLRHYPFDRQKCSIEIRLAPWNGAVNVSHENEDKYYDHLKENPILVPPEFILLNLERVFTNCQNLNINITDFCFRYDFTFQRIAIQHVLLVFLPSVLIVLLSWISFWLDVELAAPRIALGLTSLLTLSTQFNSAQRNLPAVSTIKALDIWMFACMFIVFASLIVYAISYNCDKIKRLQATIPTKSKNVQPRKKIIRRNWKMVRRNIVFDIKVKLFEKRHFTIDKIAKVAFPMVFLIFNIYFWNTFI